jgi:putative transposase
MKAHQAVHSVTTLCRVLDVSASGYYAWVARRPSPRARKDAELLEQIRGFHQASRGTYGTPRIHRDLRSAGVRVGRKRVARLLKQAGLRGVSRRKWIQTTVRSASDRPAPDLVQRQFAATAPNQLWVADITYIPTWAGTLYLAVVLDVWSRRVIGWAMETHLRTELVVAALEMALDQRHPQDVIHHSDQGCQYTAVSFGLRCRAAGVRPSMGSVGDCYDNALCETFFATLECELLDRVTLRTPREARLAVFDFIEGFYNPRRRHSALDYEAPITFEQRHRTGASTPIASDSHA